MWQCQRFWHWISYFKTLLLILLRSFASIEEEFHERQSYLAVEVLRLTTNWSAFQQWNTKEVHFDEEIVVERYFWPLKQPMEPSAYLIHAPLNVDCTNNRRDYNLMTIVMMLMMMMMMMMMLMMVMMSIIMMMMVMMTTTHSRRRAPT